MPGTQLSPALVVSVLLPVPIVVEVVLVPTTGAKYPAAAVALLLAFVALVDAAVALLLAFVALVDALDALVLALFAYV